MVDAKKPGLVHRAWQGAIGGMAATATMSALLAASDFLGVMNKQPPKKIVKALLPVKTKEETDVTALVAHVSYGVGAGCVYGALVAPHKRGIATGVLYGLAIWAISYEGWIPALGILPPATKDKPGRAGTMFVAHIVYGATLGAAAHRKR